ncbi:hypothetical protein VCHA35O142_10885 [Vibrio chagasii]|nr:hypothetical protein VCHA36P161_100180 [Vibrio chagasii]CAH6856454.1 hypothetical protein VCHA35O142_10885 [Vibrio chagasii]CAH6898227.1 hypothetical protein VCHA34P112_330029 [Vibrio chagasii]CAH7069199.1 hypothetical protein VCHA51O444_160023 [Vibrio chagasii]CAH7081008.1 hypothetical protein VCHA34P129_90021 [Vibrio chagasii]
MLDVQPAHSCPIIVFTRMVAILGSVTLSLIKLIPMVSKVIESFWNYAAKVVVYRPHDLDLSLILSAPLYSALIKFTSLSEYVTI